MHLLSDLFEEQGIHGCYIKYLPYLEKNLETLTASGMYIKNFYIFNNIKLNKHSERAKSISMTLLQISIIKVFVLFSSVPLNGVE